MQLSPDPSLKELQLLWEKQFWFRSKQRWRAAAKWYDDFVFYFSPDRKPRDIFRADVAEWKIWLNKKRRSDLVIAEYMTFGARFYRLLDELELVEVGYNPFRDMAPRRIRA